MMAYRIDEDLTVSVIDDSQEDWMTPDIVWASFQYDRDNHVFYDDEALSKPKVVMARIGPHPRVPLPAYVTGMDGEGRGDPTIPIEMLSFSVS